MLLKFYWNVVYASTVRSFLFCALSSHKDNSKAIFFAKRKFHYLWDNWKMPHFFATLAPRGNNCISNLPLALSFLCVPGFCYVSCIIHVFHTENFLLSEAPIFQMHLSYKLCVYSKYMLLVEVSPPPFPFWVSQCSGGIFAMSNTVMSKVPSACSKLTRLVAAPAVPPVSLSQSFYVYLDITGWRTFPFD
jgi:hypothetical protein